MPRTRLALFAATAAVATAAGLAQGAAAPKELVSDPAGDARVLGAAYDVVSANLKTTGTTKKVGKKIVYTPTALVTTVTLAGPPSTTGGSQVAFSADTSACDGGSFTWYYTPGQPGNDAGRVFIFGCGSDVGAGLGKAETLAVIPTVSGNTITWTLKLKELGADLPLKSLFSNLQVRTDQNDPVTGEVGTALVTEFGTIFADELNASIDTAISDATYKLQ